MSINKRGLPLLNQTQAMFMFRPVLGGPSGPLRLPHTASPQAQVESRCATKHQHLLKTEPLGHRRYIFLNFYRRLNNPWLMPCTFLLCFNTFAAQRETKQCRGGGRKWVPAVLLDEYGQNRAAQDINKSYCGYFDSQWVEMIVFAWKKNWLWWRWCVRVFGWMRVN